MYTWMVGAMKISVKNARDRISELLDRVERGEEITILRRGKTIARLVPSKREAKRLPSLAEFRASIRVKGLPLSAEVRKERDESRY